MRAIGRSSWEALPTCSTWWNGHPDMWNRSGTTLGGIPAVGTIVILGPGYLPGSRPGSRPGSPPSASRRNRSISLASSSPLGIRSCSRPASSCATYACVFSSPSMAASSRCRCARASSGSDPRPTSTPRWRSTCSSSAIAPDCERPAHVVRHLRVEPDARDAGAHHRQLDGRQRGRRHAQQTLRAPARPRGAAGRASTPSRTRSSPACAARPPGSRRASPTRRRRAEGRAPPCPRPARATGSPARARPARAGRARRLVAAGSRAAATTPRSARRRSRRARAGASGSR